MSKENIFFPKDKKNKDGTSSRCKECRKQYYLKNKEYFDAKNSKYHKENPDRQRESELKRLYGIDLNQYSKILKDQKGMCKICGSSKPSGNKRHLSVDHCHKTGVVRGLLCDHCNRGLGYFKDNLDNLSKSIEYLKEFKT